MLPVASPSSKLRADPAADAKRFEQLLDRAETIRIRGLELADLRELVALQRQISARLARLREPGDDSERIRYLNSLCVRAHTLLNAQPPLRAVRPGQWARRIAATLGQTWRAQALAWLLLAVGAAIGATLTWQDPRAVSLFVPAEIGYEATRIEQLAISSDARARFLTWEAKPAGVSAVFGSFLFAHNTQVGLLSFATGVLAGVPTLLLQLYNGILLGAFSSIFLVDDLRWRFLAWILPHGVPEMTAITLCAAGGLLFGEAVALPGRRGRAAALRRIFPAALMLFSASLPLFLFAALLESFVRESALSTTARFVIAGMGAAAVVALLTTSRWFDRSRPHRNPWLQELIGPVRNGSPDND